MDMTTFLLIALLKTSGEGGTVMIEYPTEAACLAAGAALEAKFESIPLFQASGAPASNSPVVIHTCFEAPVQR